MNILGVSGLYHDSAAALIQEGVCVAALQEERISRVKHDSEFPYRAIEEVLDTSGLKLEDVDHLVFYEKPYLKFDRILMRHLFNWPKTFTSFRSMQEDWLTRKLRLPRVVRKKLGYEGSILFCKHHEAHAASAFYSSGFDEATIVTIDGVGEWATAAIHIGKNRKIQTIKEMRYPQSWGLFYSAFTDYLGFRVNDGEYKVMGLAPYGSVAGRDRFVNKLKESLVSYDSTGWVQLNRPFFSFEISGFMLNFLQVEKVLGIARRSPEEPLTQDHFDLASAVQWILEEGLVRIVKTAIREVGVSNLCLGGGVALNCKANSVIRELEGVENMYVFPASGDAGSAVGAAFFATHHLLENERSPVAFKSPYLGSSFTDVEIQNFLDRNKYPYQKVADAELCVKVAHLIADQAIVGWFQGKMEFGPRALGNRSILGDPRRKENWPRMNQKVKFREDFRPLAPVILADKAQEYFKLEGESPYMLFTAENTTSELPAVTHVDGSSRLQTLEEKDNPLFYRLIVEFEKISGVPVLINTSFNTAGMPIVRTPQNAFQAFAESDLDYMVLGNFLISRRDYPYLVSHEKK